MPKTVELCLLTFAEFPFGIFLFNPCTVAAVERNVVNGDGVPFQCTFVVELLVTVAACERSASMYEQMST